MEPSREVAVGELRLDGPACTAYRPRLLAFFLSLKVVADSDRDDLTQTVLTKVLPQEGRFPSEKARDTYVFKAAENVWKDWLDKQKRHGAVSLDEEPRAEAGRDAKGPAALAVPARALDRVLDDEKAVALRAAVLALPVKMRGCVVQRIYQDRSLREIAQAMRIDVNTVKSHLGQARELLGKRLGRKFGIIPIA